MKTENYDVDYFIRKFEAIPEELWITGNFSDGDCGHCAYGHSGCGHNWEHSNESTALLNLDIKYFGSVQLTFINDGKNLDYPQPTPKQRVLAALYDIKAKQDHENVSTPEQIKTERIVYVTVAPEVKELTKEIHLS